MDDNMFYGCHFDVSIETGYFSLNFTDLTPSEVIRLLSLMPKAKMKYIDEYKSVSAVITLHEVKDDGGGIDECL